MSRFTLKEMFGGMGLVAVGLAMVIVSIGPIFEDYGNWSAALPIGIWYLGGMFLGAGILAPFKKVWYGAWVGLAAFCLFDLRYS